jgi:hypothetical protein
MICRGIVVTVAAMRMMSTQEEGRQRRGKREGKGKRRGVTRTSTDDGPTTQD